MSESPTGAGGAPIPAGPTPPWPADQLQAAGLSSQVLGHLVAEVSSCITTAHGNGLAVPTEAAKGVAALQALALAWAANAAGQPIDPTTRTTLGL